MENPELNAKIFDLPTTRPFAEKTIDRFELSNRITFMDGNFLENDIDGEYDVVWLSHILHGEGPDDSLKVIKKAVSALQPGGMILIHEFVLNNSMDGPLFPAIFSLNMLAGTSKGQSYSEKQLMEMLKSSGVKEIKRLDFTGVNDSGIVTGIV